MPCTGVRGIHFLLIYNFLQWIVAERRLQSARLPSGSFYVRTVPVVLKYDFGSAIMARRKGSHEDAAGKKAGQSTARRAVRINGFAWYAARSRRPFHMPDDRGMPNPVHQK